MHGRQLFVTRRQKNLQLLFVGLVIIFAVLAQVAPVVGLAGLGIIALCSAIVVELKGRAIWDEYCRRYRRAKGKRSFLREPKPIYYFVSVTVLWPFVALLGLVCILVAYHL